MRSLLVSFVVILFLCSFERGNGYTNRPFSFFTGLQLTALQDFGQSPLVYQGIGGFYGLKYASIKKRFSTFTTHFSNATLNINSANLSPTAKTTANHYTFHFNYRYLPVEIEIANGLILNFGGTLPLNLDVTQFHKLGNNNFGYDYNLTLNPTILADYRREKVHVSLTLNFPIIGYTVRPLVNNLLPTQNGEVTFQSVLKNGKFSTLNKLFYVNTLFRVHPQLKGGWNRLSFFYSAEAGTNLNIEKRKHLYQTLGVTIDFGFKRKKVK